MELQGRNLSLKMQGEDVKLLQQELRRLGLAVEDKEGVFGTSTRDAVLAFQQARGLGATGVVDQQTAAALSAALAPPPSQPAAQSAESSPPSPQGAKAAAAAASEQGDKPVRVAGRVINRRTGRGAAGVRVEAWHKERILGPGGVLTDATGAFQIDLKKSDFQQPANPAAKAPPGDKTPPPEDKPKKIIRGFFFKLFRGTTPVVVERHAVDWKRTEDGVVVTITADVPAEFVVSGQVRAADGSLLADARVRVSDKDLRTEQPLGEAITDIEGSYEIEYSATQFTRAEKRSADLVVRAFDAADAELVSSGIIFNARPVETVDLLVGGGRYLGPSEYELLLAELAPVLGELTPADLREDAEFQDITFLEKETGIERERLDFVRAAALLAAETQVPAAALYGLFRQKLPSELDELLKHDEVAYRKALDGALKDNIIPLGLKASLDEIVARLEQLRLARALEDAHVPGATPVRDVLATTLTTPEKQQTFFELYANVEGPIGEFWESLREHPELGGDVDELQTALRLGFLTHNHVPLVQHLKGALAEGTLAAPARAAAGARASLLPVSDLSDLARLDEGDWLGLIQGDDGGTPIGFPELTPGETDADKAAYYASTLTATVEAAFPTKFVASRAAESEEPGAADLGLFFDNNPQFDLRTTRVDAYLAEHPGALEGLSDAEAAVASLNRMQRAYRLTAGYAGMRALLDDGLDSARAVSRIPMQDFTARYAEKLGGPVQAARVYQKAHRSAATALALYAKFGAALNGTEVAAVPAPAPPEGPSARSLAATDGARSLAASDSGGARSIAAQAATLPDWAALFGSQALSFCECEHCASVYSPAAYLVDILNMLKSRPDASGKTAADVLFARRPDIKEIELSCRNTNTVLPYVDLVNELLESEVSPATSPPARERQTTKPTAELLAHPEYINLGRADAEEPAEGAYDILARATYPWNLPFDLWWEEVRGYFEHLGLKRETLLATFQTTAADEDGGATQTPSDLDIAAERLGLTRSERTVITTEDTDPAHVAADWGVADLGEADFGNVSILLGRSGLTFEQLEEVLATGFVRQELGEGTYQIVPADPADAATCDTTKLTVSPPPTAATLDRLHRFVRLWRKLGWGVRELDRAASALGATALDDALLLGLSRIKQLAADLKQPVGRVLDLWAAAQPDRAALAAALGITPDDLRAMIVLTEVDPFTGPTAAAEFVARVRAAKRSPFSLAQLKYLYLHEAAAGDPVAPLKEEVILLLRELQDGLGRIAAETATPPVPTRELLERRLSTVYDARQVAAALAFLDGIPLDTEANRALVRLHFPFVDPDAAYAALLVAAPPADREAYRASAVSFLLGGLLAHLRASLSEGLVRQTLGGATGLDSALAGLLLGSVLRSQLDPSRPAMNDYLSLLGNGVTATYFPNLDLSGAGTVKVEPAVDFAWGSGPPDPSVAGPFSARFQTRLFAPEREGYTLTIRTSGGVRLRLAGQPAPIIDEWDNAAPAEFKSATPLRLSSPEQFHDLVLEFKQGSPDASLQLSWSGPAVPEEIIPPRRFFAGGGLPSLAPVLTSFTRLRKAALLTGTFEITSRELAYLAAHPEDFGDFDLNALPVEAAGFSPALFRQWERLRDLFELRDGLPRADVDLFDLFAAATAGGAVADLKALAVAATGWDGADVDELVARFGLGAEDFTNEAGLLRLRGCVALRRRLGVPTPKLFAWAASPPDRAQAEDVRAAIKSKYDGAQWLVKARPLRDALRERQRAALVSYLVARPDAQKGQAWDDANGLYNHFLVDVEMSPCQLTSRIKLAISSAQLFVQRGLLNIEPEVSFSGEDARRWREWMRNYRVWEANRKVFLYPENWIRPELRDDKSPFFKELENELQQNEVTNESAESALLHYLEKLDGVARLQVCGMYHQQGDASGDDVDILHVVARTYGVPSLYYYRRRVDSAYWTPWEKIDVDIEGDHLVPTVYNRRLYLFWPVFTEKLPADVPVPEANKAGPKPSTFFEIKLAWSEHRDGKWTAKRVSADALSAVGLSRKPEDYVFKARVDGSGNLIFGCYARRA